MDELLEAYSIDSVHQSRAIFNLLFMLSNRLQTLFDQEIPLLSLKQFLLLSTIRPLHEPQSLTECGQLLGCSRQNIKKLALALEQKGFVTINEHPSRHRSLTIQTTSKADAYFEGEFSVFRDELKHLFSVYTEEEIERLFSLLKKMLEGTDALENAARKRKETSRS